jgi:GNAT superfamily N-acetyltransferase
MIQRVGSEVLGEYSRIPIAFTVESVFSRAADGSLREQRLESTWIKDYDRYAGNHPLDWPTHFDLSTWRFFVAREGDAVVGGAAANANMLYDLRVHPDSRGKGIGTALFRAAAADAAERGFPRFRVETQNVNVPACRFYERQGCTLVEINADAYPDFPDELQLIYELSLA